MRRISVLLFILLLAASFGCSASKDSGVAPDISVSSPTTSNQSPITNTYLLGYYDFYWDGSNLEIVPVRTTQMALNILGFLESSTTTKLTIDNLIVDPGGLGDDDVMDVYLRIPHPLSGSPQYNVFDVWGIIITHGEAPDSQKHTKFQEFTERYDFGFGDPPVMGGEGDVHSNGYIWIAGTDDVQVLNADGYTTLFNQVEYTGTPDLCHYRDGFIGPDGIFEATLNPYKYFGDWVGDDQYPLSSAPAQRGIFKAGESNARKYRLQNENGFPWISHLAQFSYAVCAHWNEGSPPYNYSNFPTDANAGCPIFLKWPGQGEPEISGLTTQGGSATITCKLHDWQGWTGVQVRAEIPGVFYQSKIMNDLGSGEFSIPVTNEFGGPGTDYVCLITAQSGTEKNFQLIRGITVNEEQLNWPSTLISNSPNTKTPQLEALDSTLYCAWIDASAIRWSGYSGGSWNTPTDLITGETNPTRPRFAFDASNAHLVWQAGAVGSEDVFYAEFDPANPTIPLPPYCLDQGLGKSLTPDIDLLSNGDSYTFWAGSALGVSPRPIYERHQSGSWQPAVLFSPPPIPDPPYQDNCFDVHCVIDSSGNIHAVWTNETDWSIEYASWNLVDSLPRPPTIITSFNPPPGQPDICIRNGTVWIAWYQGDGIHYTHLVGGNPTEDQLVDNSTQWNAKQPVLCSAPNGNVMVFWVDKRGVNGDGNSWQINAASLNGGTPAMFNEIAGPVANESEKLFYYDAAVDSAGTYHVVWSDSTGLHHKHFP